MLIELLQKVSVLNFFSDVSTVQGFSKIVHACYVPQCQLTLAITLTLRHALCGH